jgi:hypothetical protein
VINPSAANHSAPKTHRVGYVPSVEKAKLSTNIRLAIISRRHVMRNDSGTDMSDRCQKAGLTT